jgi:hypothetical protein
MGLLRDFFSVHLLDTHPQATFWVESGVFPSPKERSETNDDWQVLREVVEEDEVVEV